MVNLVIDLMGKVVDDFVCHLECKLMCDLVGYLVDRLIADLIADLVGYLIRNVHRLFYDIPHMSTSTCRRSGVSWPGRPAMSRSRPLMTPSISVCQCTTQSSCVSVGRQSVSSSRIPPHRASPS